MMTDGTNGVTRDAFFGDSNVARHAISTGRRWFFGIGINEYDQFPHLKNAVKDVREVQALLASAYGFDSDYARLLIDQDANAEAIIDAFDKLTEHVQ